MDTGYYKFYEKKFKILLLLLSCVVFCVGGYFMIKDTDSFYRLVGWVGIIFFGLGFIKLCLKLFSGKAYIEITPTYIQIDNFEKLGGSILISSAICSCVKPLLLRSSLTRFPNFAFKVDITPSNKRIKVFNTKFHNAYW